ncbi:Zinc transporter 6, chloroplastic [Stylosanthes scabra]|uniref:Zinc transporter 6, chloroplastic n=1 Tax=Stylosanthes scabra TaxID=79078 RepID=A0ABU6UJS2_9FABA|nr:Zinc transporter 6, chloroplastic [Stylosanthes scabra]
MSAQPCATDILTRATSCRDGSAAAHLKFISIFVIFFTSMFGMSSPVLLARLFQGKSLYDRAVALIKCFAAGVILSTSLVHVLPDAYASLADCRVATRHPWRDFPFSGLVTLIGALLALAVDLVASSHVEHSQYAPVKTNEKESSSGESRIELGGGGAGCHGGDNGVAVAAGGSAAAVEEEVLLRLKQKMVSQVLEIGIIFHSVIIGVTMGMSQNVCTIRPLVAALAFHQIFEGMGLGGCVAQAGFSFGTMVYMCFMFSVTTPMGIVLGMAIFSLTGYDDSNPNALIIEGLLGSVSSGVLIYMALVDLIAVDFFHNKLMNSNPKLKKASFLALTLGSAAMSILALWA